MKFVRYHLIGLLLILMSISVSAQPGPPEGDPDQQPVPLTGIEWLLAGGAALGGYKALKKKREREEEGE
jgi:hypothetical protein